MNIFVQCTKIWKMFQNVVFSHISFLSIWFSYNHFYIWHNYSKNYFCIFIFKQNEYLKHYRFYWISHLRYVAAPPKFITERLLNNLLWLTSRKHHRSSLVSFDKGNPLPNGGFPSHKEPVMRKLHYVSIWAGGIHSTARVSVWKPGARPTKHISIEFEIRWKFRTL